MSQALRSISGSKAIVFAAVTATIAIGIAFVASQSLRQNEAITIAEEQMQAKAELLAEHMARTFEAAGSNLRAVEQIRTDALANAYDLGQAHLALKALHAASPVFISLVWTDAAGDRIATSFTPDPPPVNLAYRDHFQQPRLNREYAARPYIGAPVYAEALKSWILAITLRLEDADGAFLGVAGGTVDPAYLSAVYARAGMGASGVVRLVRGDGVLLTQHPYDVTSLGNKVRLPDGVGDDPENHAAHDHAEGQITVKAMVAGGNLYVVASQSIDEALAGHWRIFWQEALIVGVLLAILLLGAFLLARVMWRREELEVEVRLRADRSRAYAEASSDWFWALDADLRFVWVSKSVEKTLGVNPNWFIGKRAEDVVGADQADEHMSYWRTLRVHIPFSDFEYVGVGRNRDRSILISGIPQFDDGGNFEGYLGSAKDITDLRQAEQRFGDVIRSFPGRVMVFDQDERLVLFNQGQSAPIQNVGAQLVAGDTFEQMLRKLVAAGQVDDAKDDPEGWIAMRIDRFRARSGSTLLSMGGRVIEAIERPMADGGTISLRFDVTERERSAAAVAEARRAAEKANQAKSEFLASMSHEFRTPLNAIIGFSQVLQLDKTGNLTDLQKDYIDNVEKSGQHLLNLVSEVLDLAGIEAGKLRLSIEPIETGALIGQAIATMEPVAANAGIRLEMEPPGGLPAIRADAQRVRQILLNLLSNAIKYNRAEGYARVTARAEEETVRIAIEDNGIGIATKYFDQVFTPFSRLGVEQSIIEGAGIGLSLSRQLVEAMNGRIGFESTEGEGSTFWIELPAAEAAAAPVLANGGVAMPELAASAAYSLLYVEDNPSNLRLMESLIGTLPNVRMYSAPSGPIGLDLARANRPDIIVLDLNLPRMSGLEILKVLQTLPETRTTPVIALTAAARPSDIERGLEAGFFRYVTKPLDVNEFLAAIESALENRPATARKPAISRNPAARRSDIGD